MNTPRFRLLAAALAAALTSIWVAKALNTHAVHLAASASAARAPAAAFAPQAPAPAPIVPPPIARSARVATVPVSPIATPTPEPPVLPRELFASAWGRARHPALANFEKWTARFLAAKATGNQALVQEGVALAQARRGAMQSLIQQDPKAAIASTVPMAVRASLPPEVESQLETRVAARANLSVQGALARPGESVAQTTTRSVIIKGREYHAFVYGRRLNQATKRNISIQGVAVNGTLAISESPVRQLEPGEPLPDGTIIRPICPISGESVGPGSPAGVVVGDKVQPLCHIEHAALYEQQLIQAEADAGPYDVPDDAGDPEATAADGAAGATDVVGRPPVSWSEGPKKIILIRVDFSDLPGVPITGASTQESTTYLNNLFNQAGGVADFYAQGSYGLTSIVTTAADITAVLRMPSTAAYYAQGDGVSGGYNGTLHSDAEAAATAAGFNLSTYDRIGVVFTWLGNITGSFINYGGLGEIQGKDFWTNGESDFRVCAHEIGHTYGLQHCNLWEVTDGNPVSDNGESFEYDDPFGVMGSGNTNINYQFDQWQKTILHWIPDSSVPTITKAGVYRVFRFDHPSADTSQTLALKIVRNNVQDYWIGLRQLFTANSTIFNGAYVLWGYNSVIQGNLIDFKLNDTYANDDSTLKAGLPVGNSFHDAKAGITIQPLAKGGTTPEEYLDIQIGFDPAIEWQSTDFSVDQASGNATLTLVRTGDPTAAVGATYTTSDGSATAPRNYTSRMGVVNWAAGDVSPKTITIPVSALPQITGELSFNVTLSNPTNGASVKGIVTTTVNIGTSGLQDTGYGAPLLTGGINALARQPDGKFIVAGSFGADATDGIGAGFTRLNADGTADSSFFTGTGAAGLNAAAVQLDGRILLAGNQSGVNGIGFPRLDRLNADGTLDSSFNPGTGPNALLRALLVQPDGRILVGGDFTAFNGVTIRAVSRLNPDGSVDPSFSSPAFTGNTIQVDTMVLQPDGRIVVAGLFNVSGTSRRSGVARLNANGSLDTTFDPGSGAALAGNNNSTQEVEALALQTDGSLVLGGTFTAFNGIARASLVRLNSTGSVDPTFNPGADSFVHALLVQPDQKILVGGNFATLAGVSSTAAGRLNVDGSFDSSFAVSGIFSKPVNAWALQADGELLVASKNSPTLARVFSGLGNEVSTVQFTTASATGAEGNSVVLTATRTGSSLGVISVNYAAQLGSATATRFAPVSGTLSWADGDASNRTITVQLQQDGLYEAAENLAIDLTPIAGAAVLGQNDQVIIALPADAADTQAPALTVSSPMSGSTVTLNPFTVTGTASDAGSGNNGIVSVTVNGIEATGDKTTGGGMANWNVSVPLSQGTNTLTVVALDSAGNSTSVPVTVSYQFAPAISTQPADVGIFSGNTATLSVGISSSGAADPTVTYQWYIGQAQVIDNPIAGATSATYTTPPLSVTTHYWVRLENTNGYFANSRTAIVTVFANPQFIDQSFIPTINTGQSTSLSVDIDDTGAGNTALSYQWYQGMTGDTSTPVSTDANFTTPLLTATTSFWVRVTNSANYYTDSGTFTVMVNQPPTILTQPTAPSFNSGGSTTFTVVPATTGTSDSLLSYQWFKGQSDDGTTPVGAGGPTYTTPALTVSTPYWVRLTNSTLLSTNSATAVALVNGPPVIGVQPSPTLIKGGKTATLVTTVARTGTSDSSLSYQWYLGATGDTSHPIVGAVGSVYTTPPLTANATYWVSIGNSAGLRVSSNSAVVTVDYSPTIGIPPVGSRIVTGQTRTLNVTVTATGTPDSMLMYQWYQGESGDLSKPVGTNANTYTTPPLTQDTSYFVRVTNSAHFFTDSGTAAVKVDQSARANLTPMPLTAKWTDAVVVSANPSGTVDPASYVPTTGLFAAAAFKNMGAVATSGPFDGQFILEPNHKVIAFTQAKALASGAGASILAKSTLALGKLAASEYTLTLELNPDGKVQENILTDNSYAKHFVVANPAYKKLATPTKLRAFPNLAQSLPGVDLFWTPGDIHATNYTVSVRTKSGSKWSAWADLGTSVENSYRDTVTPAGTIRDYRVTATDGTLFSPASAASAAINLTATPAAEALANLTPTSFIVAQHTGATADEALDDQRDIYATVTIQNTGTVAVAKTGFAVAVDVDGVRHLTKLSTLALKLPLAPGASLTLPDFSLGRLEGGTHSFAVRVDSAHQIDESDETDNTITRSLVVTAAKPNLAGLVDPASGFAQPIIVSNQTGATASSPIVAANHDIYLTVGITNLGVPLAAGQNFNVTFYLDGLPISYLGAVPITPGDENTWIIPDLNLGSFGKGVHTFTVKIDSDEDIDESEEGDNLISTHFTVK